VIGRQATPIQDTGSKYQRGRKILETLSGQRQGEPRGYAAFSPEIEVFLKEHLFADIFERDILSYADRELATVSALVTLGGVEPMMQSHMGISIRNGISRDQLFHLLDIIESNVGKTEADNGRKVLSDTGGAGAGNGAQSSTGSAVNLYSIFPKGEKAPEANFTGVAWVHSILPADSNFNVPIACVVFEPGARSNWHSHAGGQSLIAIEGTGYYQERGKPIRILRKGDAVRCPPDVPHWHGASPEQGFTQVAVTPNTAAGRVKWMEKVTEDEYRRIP
jgi:4-carboxymuconolactone decarboxylase